MDQKIPAADLLAMHCNLDRKNPRSKTDVKHLPPAELAASILDKEAKITNLLTSIRSRLAAYE